MMPKRGEKVKIMYKVDLYMENAGKTPAERDAWYGYVLAYQGRTLHTVTGFGNCVANRHRRDLIMFLEALIRCRECSLTVHTDSAYLKGGFERIRRYIENGWVTSQGDPVKNMDLWKQVYTAAQGKEIQFVPGQHEYTNWLKTEIRRRQDGERNTDKSRKESGNRETEETGNDKKGNS